jgi:aspartate ammonia-lyase
MGRTHLQDAVPMSLGQEFHGWGTTIGEEVERIAEVRQFLHEINLGATAIGTGITAHPATRNWLPQVPLRTHRLQVHPRPT